MNKRKILAVVVAVATFAGNVQAFGASFTDINDVPWDGAKTYINSVADLGLMAGDYNDNGKLVFRAKGVVTYCETMQLIYALSQKNSGQSISSATQTKWTSVMNGYKIPSWVQPAVAFGLENSIVTISDIPGFVNSAGKSTNATRQDVAVMFGRYMKDYGTINGSASLSFKDASNINSVAVPYVDLLNRLGIISGDTDNNFNPKSTINRAEMAVFVSKSYDVMRSGTSSSNNNNSTNNNPVQTQAGSITGTITAVTPIGSNTAITVEGGSSTMSFTGSSTTPVLSGSTRVVISTLAVGDKVVASYNGQELVSVLVTTKASSTNSSTSTSTSEVSGTYVSISTSYIKIKVSSSTKTYNFIDDAYDNTTFYVDGSKSTYSKFKNAASTDNTVRLVLDSNGKISKAYIEDGTTGTFVSISTSGIKIKVSGSSKSYDFVDEDYDEVDFEIDGDDSTYSKVKSKASTGDTIKLTLDSDGDVKKVNLVTEDDDDEVNGTFVSISTSGIKIKKSGSSKSYDFVDEDYDEVDFEIDGDDSTYSKVKSKASTSDTVKLTLDSDGDVKKVNLITDDDEDYDVEGTFVSISSSGIKIKKSGSSKSYDFVDEDYDEVDFEIDGDDSTYSKVKSKASTSDTVELTLDSDGDVKKVNLVTEEDDDEVKGTFVSISSSGIKIKKSGSSKSYDFEDEDSSNVKFYYNSTSKTYSYIKSNAESGDTVKLVLSGSEVTKVYVTTGSSGDVSGKLSYLTSSKLKVSGSSSYYTFKNSSSCEIEVTDGRSRTITDFDDLEEAFEDEKLMQVEVTLNSDNEVTEITGYVYEVSGDVTSVSTSAETIKVKTGSRTVTYTLSSDVSIDNYGSYKNTVSGLKSVYDDYSDDMEVVLTLDKNAYVTKVEVDV
ncbi:MAG: S-layer homology domain-containing protein [Lachnospiraceae bacterium]|nr:S-layer homology domain-containing protein [Lachnospiraceae bacterium]